MRVAQKNVYARPMIKLKPVRNQWVRYCPVRCGLGRLAQSASGNNGFHCPQRDLGFEKRILLHYLGFARWFLPVSSMVSTNLGVPEQNSTLL